MTYKKPGVLAAEPKPIEGTYRAIIGPDAISVALFDTNEAPYAQATSGLPADLLKLDEAKRMATITDAAKRAARLINTWGALAKAVERDLGVSVALEPKVVLQEEL